MSTQVICLGAFVTWTIAASLILLWNYGAHAKPTPTPDKPRERLVETRVLGNLYGLDIMEDDIMEGDDE